MIVERAVLILGAGASAHLSFPSGPALAESIWHGVRKENATLFQLLRECGFEAPLIMAFGEALRRSAQPSVDLFLENREEFLGVGKTAIAAQLMPYEIEDNLFGGAENWYPYLFRRLGPSLEDVQQSRLSIITFNYDRSLDQFLFLALQNAFKLATKDVVSHLANIPIVHVYGQLGELPHWNLERGRPYQPPDSGKVAAEVLAVKDSIKIVSEGGEEDRELNRARSLIEGATLVAFVGFGYLSENVKRLGFPRSLPGALWGSAFDLRDGEQAAVKALFGGLPNAQIRLGDVNLKTLEFLRKFPILR